MVCSRQWLILFPRNPNVKTAHSNTDENPQCQFCTLEYRALSESVHTPHLAQVILLVLRDKEGSLRFLVHPELQAVVRGEDLIYVESLLRDFQLRAGLHPDALFKQLSSLGVGPLVTHETGSIPSDQLSSMEVCSHFVRL